VSREQQTTMRSTQRTQPLAVVVAAVALVANASAARAQSGATSASGVTVGASIAVASLWDDETHLGRGLATAAEISAPAGPHLRVGAEGGWFQHDRDSGYLAASGTVLHLMGRADLFLSPRTWRTRPFVGAALGVARSTGTLSLQTSAPGGASATTSRQPWTHTQSAWNVRLGVRIAASSRLAFRPEVSAGSIGSSDTRGILELPLLRLQGGLAVEWGPR